MAEFFRTQLDYIFFFYGLAFILLGAVCFAIVRSGPREPPWAVLGSFGIVHGVNEWLDLLALSVGDAPAFALARLAFISASTESWPSSGLVPSSAHSAEPLMIGMSSPGNS